MKRVSPLQQVILLLSLSCASALANSPIPSSFLICISSSGSGVCTLPVGTYTVTSTLHVMRNNVYVTGGSSDPYATTLQRDPGTLGLNSILQIDSGYTGVVVEDLTFDGNRFSSVRLPNGASINCDGSGAFPWPLGTYDIVGQSGSMSTLINDNFFNGPGGGIWADGYTNIASSNMESAHWTGVWLTGISTIEDTSIALSGTAAITMAGTNNGASRNQLFWNRYEMPDLSGGGSLTVWFTSTGALAAENVIDGFYWATTPGATANGCPEPPTMQTAGGIEIGTTNAGLYNNEVYDHAGGGIGMHGTNGVIISGNDPWCPSCSAKSVHDNYFTGIWAIYDTGPNYNLTLDHVRASNNGVYQIWLDHVGTSSSISPGFVKAGTSIQSDACISGTGTLIEVDPATSFLTYYMPSTPGACP